MKAREFKCGVTRDFCHIWKISLLLTILFTVVFVCSLRIASYDRQNSFIVHRDCAVCKFLVVYPAVGEMSLRPMIAPDFMHISIIVENLLLFFAVLTVVPGTRAPPFFS